MELMWKLENITYLVFGISTTPGIVPLSLIALKIFSTISWQPAWYRVCKKEIDDEAGPVNDHEQSLNSQPWRVKFI